MLLKLPAVVQVRQEKTGAHAQYHDHTFQQPAKPCIQHLGVGTLYTQSFPQQEKREQSKHHPKNHLAFFKQLYKSKIHDAYDHEKQVDRKDQR